MDNNSEYVELEISPAAYEHLIKLRAALIEQGKLDSSQTIDDLAELIILELRMP
jgi:hypothetical protein